MNVLVTISTSRTAGRVVLGVCLVCILFTSAPALQMTRIAVLPQHLNSWGDNCSRAQIGDADHDHMMEMYGVDEDHGDTVFGFEYLGGGQFERFYTGILASRGISALGDGDRDGLVELIDARTRYPSGVEYRIFESADSSSFPSDSVWFAVTNSYQSPRPRYCDLDGDGRTEIGVGYRGAGIKLYENSGDNCYDSVATLSCQPASNFSSFDTGDFDRDGLCELVASRTYRINVFEATGRDNEYILSAVCTLAVDTDHVVQVLSAGDMDQDGRPEFLALTALIDLAKLSIFESGSHAKYDVVWQSYLPVAGLSNSSVAAGDVDGDGVNEFAYATGGLVEIFKSIGPDEYEPIWALDSSLGLCALFDVNGDGRAELIFDQDVSTYPHCNIYEDTTGLAMAEMFKSRPRTQVKVIPTVIRLGATALFSGIPPDAAVGIHGIDGRLVRRQPQVRQSNWTWNLRDQAGNLVPAGTSVAAIRSRERLVSLKLCIVK
jgi:hypothetical protein